MAVAASLRAPVPGETIHPLVDGKASPECVRSWFATPCPHHPGEKGKRGKPQLCTRQACESSAQQNSMERARDAWDGTAAVPTKLVRDRHTGIEKKKRDWVGKWRHSSTWHSKARGLRHFGETALAVFTFTLPEELRHLCRGERGRLFRRAADGLALQVLARLFGSDNALWWARSWFHPEGDDADGHYQPHENVLVPMVCWQADGTTDAKGRANGRVHWPRRTLPRSWLGADGWVCEAWRDALVEIFGQWWPRGAPAPAVVWYFKPHVPAEEKMHKLQYFGRVFPRWAKSEVREFSRPRSLGLSHWKNRHKLSQVTTRCAHLPPVDACPDCLAEGVHPDDLPSRIPVVAATPEQLEQRIERALAAHTCTGCQSPEHAHPDHPYLEYRRIMAQQFGPAPPTGRPEGPSPPREWVDPTTGEVFEVPVPGAELGELCAG